MSELRTAVAFLHAFHAVQKQGCERLHLPQGSNFRMHGLRIQIGYGGEVVVLSCHVSGCSARCRKAVKIEVMAAA